MVHPLCPLMSPDGYKCKGRVLIYLGGGRAQGRALATTMSPPTLGLVRDDLQGPSSMARGPALWPPQLARLSEAGQLSPTKSSGAQEPGYCFHSLPLIWPLVFTLNLVRFRFSR